jgi:hypothetical protein
LNDQDERRGDAHRSRSEGCLEERFQSAPPRQAAIVTPALHEMAQASQRWRAPFNRPKKLPFLLTADDETPL